MSDSHVRRTPFAPRFELCMLFVIVIVIVSSMIVIVWHWYERGRRRKGRRVGFIGWIVVSE